jgi:signal transduction histidine kinase
VEKRELLGLHPRKLALMIGNLVERNRLRRQAEELSQRQTELLSVLSHDVRAPFQALIGTIQLLRKSRIPSEAAANVETLYQCAHDQLSFINSLLELLTLESGQAGLRLVELDLNLPVNQAAQRLRVLAEEKGITLDLDLQLDLMRIRGDLGRISQVINNLLTNAIKFTPPGGTIVVTTRSAQVQGAWAAELAVRDTGIGVDGKLREKIFQRFNCGRERGTGGERGAGLGLSICREIMQLHGGMIELDPEVSEGSRFVACFLVRPPIHGISCGKGIDTNSRSSPDEISL